MVGTVPVQNTFPPILPEPQNDPTNASNLTSGTVAPARLPLPTTTTIGAVFAAAAPANEFQTGIDVFGNPDFAQPTFANLLGILLASQFPALTGDVTTAAGSLATLIAAGAVTSGRIASGAAASNVGTLGGDLAGSTLPNPTIAAAAVTAGKLASGAAVSNIGINGLPNSGLAQMPTLTVKSNILGGAGNAADNTLTAILDAIFGNTQGNLIGRGPTIWQAISAATSTLGQPLTSNGPGALPTYQNPGAATAAPRSSVRQTVQGGPASAGLPNFLPATSGTLALSTANVSTGINALTIAAAQGYNATGQTDLITQFTSNQSFGTLAASATNYLWVNASTGALGFSTLPPIYQFGGTIAVTSGQFTFDYQAMIGYVGNGTTAVATPLVYVGEATTSASAVTATVAYAYNGFYDSGVIAPPIPGLATLVSKNANLGSATAYVRAQLVCVTADQGFSSGDVTDFSVAFATGNVSPVGTFSSGLTVGFNTGAGSSGFGIYVINKTTGAIAVPTAASWGYRITAHTLASHGGS